MDAGKIPNDILEKLIKTDINDPSVIVGPQIGMDGAIISVGTEMLIVASDPITFDTDKIGYYSVAVNANDVAVMGGIPQYFIATILLPKKISEYEIEDIFTQLKSACENMNIALIGGHTEITTSVTKPVISGTMLGRVYRKLVPEDISVGDIILQVNPVAIEGTAILASFERERLLELGLSSHVIDEARNTFNDLGICIATPAILALESSKDIYLMHDPTEGGIATALCELATGAKRHICVEKKKIIITDECQKICDILDLNPLGLISSGTLLIIAKKSACEDIKRALDNYIVSEIGVVTDNPILVDKPKVSFFEPEEVFPFFARDEMARYYDN